MAVALGVEQSCPRGEDHHVRVQPHVHQRRAAERELDDDALLRLLRPILTVLDRKSVV